MAQFSVMRKELGDILEAYRNFSMRLNSIFAQAEITKDEPQRSSAQDVLSEARRQEGLLRSRLEAVLQQGEELEKEIRRMQGEAGDSP